MKTLWNRLLSMLGLRKAPPHLAAPAHRPDPLRVPVEVEYCTFGVIVAANDCVPPGMVVVKSGDGSVHLASLDQPFSGHGYIDDPARRLVVRLPARGGAKS